VAQEPLVGRVLRVSVASLELWVVKDSKDLSGPRVDRVVQEPLVGRVLRVNRGSVVSLELWVVKDSKEI
jgi:flagellar biosynthesis regulator FlaF